MKPLRMLRVTAPYFCAGISWHWTNRGWVCYGPRTAPILKWMGDKPLDAMVTYMESKGWKYEVLDEGKNNG